MRCWRCRLVAEEIDLRRLLGRIQKSGLVKRGGLSFSTKATGGEELHLFLLLSFILNDVLDSSPYSSRRS